MASTNAFKKYQRVPRSQLSEESFKLGMNYTNAPLDEGYVRSMINYDIKENGEVLAPRPGLRVREAFLAEDSMYAAESIIRATSVKTEENGLLYRMVVSGSPEANAAPGLSTGSMHLYTIPQNVDSTIINTIPTKPMNVRSTFGQGGVNPYFWVPEDASIHGVPLVQSYMLSRHVGTIAYNNNYYFTGKPLQLTSTNGVIQVTEQDPCLHKTKFYNERYIPEKITPKALTPKEAVLWGYNMLAADPYSFSNIESAASIQLTGMLPYDSNDKLMLSPQINQTITFKCFYTVNPTLKYTVVWEWKEASTDTWTELSKTDVTFTGLPALTQVFSSPAAGIMVRVSCYRWVDNAAQTIADQVLTVGFNFDKAAYGNTANVENKKYTLTKSRGMTYWKNRLVCYGVPEDATLLFMSEINDPSYFPFPNNSDIFEEAIIYALPFLDNLLVFTTSKLYLISLSEDGLSWSKKCIQGNLDIKDWDLHLIQVVKNMVFFKSGNYYYMVVPKASSTTGELTIAPISKPIISFLDKFQTNVNTILEQMYNFDFEEHSIELVHYYNYLDFEDVCNVYVYKTDTGLLINLVLLYDTVLRSWRIYFYESQRLLTPIQQDATKKGILASTFGIATEGMFINTGLQFLEWDTQNLKDFYLPDGVKRSDSFATMNTLFNAKHTYHNYQWLDTGYREHNSDMKKRYRELQLKFHNISQLQLKFFTAFYIDGEERRSMYKYTMMHDTVPESEKFGEITMERELVTPEVLPGATLLGINDEDYDAWTLDTSMFPEAYFWKVRIPVSGKGYTPRMQMFSKNEERYELLNMALVFRNMNSR